MSDQKDKAFRRWAKVLNPTILRGNLITAAIFLAAYELLRGSVIDRIRDFFTHEFRDGVGIPSETYASDCLALDKSTFRASLLWLRKMSAIDDSDIGRSIASGNTGMNWLTSCLDF